MPSRVLRGLSLSELAVVMVVLGVVATLSLVTFSDQVGDARTRALQSDASTFDRIYRNLLAADEAQVGLDVTATEPARVARAAEIFEGADPVYAPVAPGYPGQAQFASGSTQLCLTLPLSADTPGAVSAGACTPPSTVTTTTVPGFVSPTIPPRPPTTPTPGSPTSLAATLDAAVPTTVSVSFTPGSGTAVSFELTCVSSGSGVTRSATGASSPISVSSLTAGEPYTCTATASNPDASPTTSPASAPTSSFTPYNPALAPTNVAAEAQTRTSVLVSWTPLTSTAARPVSGYAVFVDGSASSSCTASGASSTSCLVTGLVENTSYSFTVRAHHPTVTGTLGAASSAVVLTTPRTPAAPTAVSASLVSATPTTVSVSFVEGAGSPDSFEITCVSSGSGVTRSATGASSPISVSSLTAGEPYTCTATASRSLPGETTTSPASAPTSSFTPYNPALAPTGLSASNVDINSLTVNWAPLTSTAARPVSGYRVYVNSSPVESCTAVGASASSCAISGLAENTSYSFTVRAYHLATLGAASSPLSATTARTPDPISSASVTTPATSAYTWYCPTGGMTNLRTAVAGFCSTNATITRNLNWSVVVDASAVNSGSASLTVTAFTTSNNVAVPGATTTFSRSTAGTATGTFTGLATSTAYYVRVSVTDDAGRQLTLNSASVTTPAVESTCTECFFTDPTTVSVTTAWRNAADNSTAEDYVLRHSTASTGGGAGNAYDSNWSTLFQINNMTESFPFAAATGIDLYSGWSYVNNQTCTASTKNACYVAADASSEGWIHTSLDVDIVGARFRNPARFNTYFYFRDTVANAWRIPAGVTTGTLVVPSIYTACGCSGVVPSLDGTTWATRVLGSAGYAIDSNWTTMDVGASGITNMSINTNIFGMRGIQWRFYVLARKTTAGTVVQVADTQIQLRLTYSERRQRQR